MMRFMTLVTVILGAMLAHADMPRVSGEISRIGDTTHLEFKGLDQWVYESPKKSGVALKIVMPPFDDKTVMALQTWTCPLIKEVKVDRNGPDGRYEVEFNLSSEAVESFDYQTDEPSHLIFDFYKQVKKAEPAAAAALPEKATNPTTKAKKRAKKTATVKKIRDEYQKVDRAPAGGEILAGPAGTDTAAPDDDKGSDIRFERGVFDGGDPNYDRFRIKGYEIREDAVIASRQNIYIRFPMLALETKRFAEMVKTTPEYVIAPEDTEENKAARLLITLFEKNKPGGFFEAYKFFETKYPQSKYDEIVKNLLAESHVKLFMSDGNKVDYEKFRSVYEYLIETYPDSVMTERLMLLLGYSSLESGQAAETLRQFQRYLVKYPKSAERDHVRFAIAESLTALGKHDEAIEMYNDVQKNPVDKNYAVEATFRVGDVLFSQQRYGEALTHYKAALSKHPSYASVFPNASYNISEAQFWLGEYVHALDSFVDFVKLFPRHPHGASALTRIGELQEILGADQQKVIGAFIESYFRFPGSQGAEIARIRMLSQGLRTMKDREMKQAITEIDEISKHSKLPRIQEFVTLMKAEGMSRRREFRDSLNLLLSYFQEHPTTADLPVFRARILRNISEIMKSEVEKRDYMEALNFHGKYSTTWLKNSGRIDIPYFLALAYEQAGVVKESEKLLFSLRDRLKKIKGGKEERERKVYEHLPTQDQLNLRIAAVALEQRKFQESAKALSEIKEQMSTPEEIERVRIKAAVSEAVGDAKNAIANLEKLLKTLKGGQIEEVKPRLQLIRLYLKSGSPLEAEKHLAEVEKIKDAGLPVHDDDWAQTIELRGDVYLKKGEKLAAVESYLKLLENFESTKPLSSVRYRAGQILFDNGDLKGAEKIWSGLNNQTGQFYKNLSQEKLNQAEWQDAYKKYIDRIPAAEGLK